MKILPICIILLFLTACVPAFGEQELELLEPSVTSPIITSDPQPSLTPTQPATATLSPTILPTFTQELLDTATATITMPPPEPQVTQGASDDPCKPYARKERWGSGKSPDEQWIATSCYESREGESSFLLAYNLNAGKEWRIYYKDYARNGDFERRNQIGVFHWSQDGRFLYTTSYTLLSGCCSIGYQTLLVRLDLETGQQTDIVNFTDNLFGRADFSISPSDRYILYVPQNGENILYILDQDTWKQRQIKLKYKNTGAGFIVMSNNEDKLILLLRVYPHEYQGDLTYGELVVINLVNGSQKKILSGKEYEDSPRPVRWQDDDHVVLYDNDGYWLLNIHTAELTKIEKP